MSIQEIDMKVLELRELQAMVEEATAQIEAKCKKWQHLQCDRRYCQSRRWQNYSLCHERKNKKVGTVKVNSLKIKGSRLNPYFDKNLSQPTQEVKQKFSVDDAEYLRLAENPAQNYDRLNEMVRQAAEDAGYDHLFYHGAKNGVWLYPLATVLVTQANLLGLF